MEYTASRPLEGSPERALDLITAVFASNGYALVSRDSRSVRFESGAGEGKGRNPMLGDSTVMFNIKDGSLTMLADMGGVRKMGTVIIFLPVALALFFLVLFGILFGELGAGFIAMVSLGPVLPWVFLAPLLIRWLKKRSVEALDRLLESMAKASGA
jgi:hypothetical protein